MHQQRDQLNNIAHLTGVTVEEIMTASKTLCELRGVDSTSPEMISEAVDEVVRQLQVELAISRVRSAF